MCSHHAKELAAANQTAERLQAAELHHMQEELARILQQQRVEAGVCSAQLAHLVAKATTHRSEGAAWATRREEDVQAKGRELEVRANAGVGAQWHAQMQCPSAALAATTATATGLCMHAGAEGRAQ